MKLKQITTLTALAAAALGICICNAQETNVVNTTTNYSPVNIALTVTTNAPSVTNTNRNVTTWKIGKSKITNKTLLSLLGSTDFANTNWPKDAKLVVGWDEPWNGDVLVINKTGTVLYDATTSESGHFSIDFFNDYGAYTETYNQNNPGFVTWNESYTGYFELSDEAGNTDIFGYGPSTQNFIQKWDAKGNYSTWSDSEKFTAHGSEQEWNGTDYGTVSGSINAAGHGKGENTYNY